MATDLVAGWLVVVVDDLRQVVDNLKGPMPSLSGAATIASKQRKN
jgi:hypothetical protein